MTGPSRIRERREINGLGRNETAKRADMGARTLSYVEDGIMRATPQILDRINGAIDSLIADREAG